MQPDRYDTRNNSHPTTALAAWMSHAKLTRKGVAKEAGIAENTMSSAMRGSVRLSTAELIAKVVRLDARVIADGQVRGAWSLDLRTDGSIEVSSDTITLTRDEARLAMIGLGIWRSDYEGCAHFDANAHEAKELTQRLAQLVDRRGDE